MADFSSGLGGAASGAYAGSAFGPIGTIAGGLLGGIGGLFSKKKKKKKPNILSTFSPEQESLFRDQIQGLRGQGGPFQDLYKYNAEAANQNFNQNFQRPALRSFNEDIIPSITGQYRGGNLMNSTYSGEALSRAGRNVQENLDALRSNMQFQGQEGAQNRQFQGIGNALNPTTFDYQQPYQNPGIIDQLISGVGGDATKYLGDYIRQRNNVPYQQSSIPAGVSSAPRRI